MLIHKALLKYRYSNFSFEILEYCEPKKCIEREQYYLDLLKPEYNILKNAGSPLGFKHSEESKIFEHLKNLHANPEFKAKRLAQLKVLNADPEFQAKRLERLNRIHADPEFQAKRLERLKVCNANPEYKAKRLAQLKIYNSSKEHKEHLKRLNSSKEHKEQLKRLNSSKEHKEHLKRLAIKNKGRPKTEGSGRPSIPIEVFDSITNEATVYPSIIEAARAIGCVKGTIQSALKVLKEKGVTRLIKKKYSVKLFK
jgi:group I intron endonuclease